MSSSESSPQEEALVSSPSTAEHNLTAEHHHGAYESKRYNNSADDIASCSSSLEEEERKPHWDVGAGDLSIFNDVPRDRSVVRFLQRTKPEIINILNSVLNRKKRFKYNIVLQMRLSNNYSLPPTPFKSEYITVESAASIEDTYDVLADLIVLKTNKCRTIYQILRVEVNIKKLRTRCGSFIGLPSKASSFKAVINPRNHDNYCFKYALLIAVKYLLKDHKMLSLEDIDISSEQIVYGEMALNFGGLTFPVEVRDVRIFEQNNPALSVNVFGLEKKRNKHVVVGPLYRTRRERKIHINLLFLENLQKNLTHYAYITRLAKLLRGTIKSKSEAYFCNTCLKHFTEISKYREHKNDKSSCTALRTLS